MYGVPFPHEAFFGPGGHMIGLFAVLAGFVALIGILWALFWKALALWNAARNRQKGWFIALIIINTFGILEIVYLLWFRKDNTGNTTPELFPIDDLKEKVSQKQTGTDTLPVAETSPAE